MRIEMAKISNAQVVPRAFGKQTKICRRPLVFCLRLLVAARFLIPIMTVVISWMVSSDITTCPLGSVHNFEGWRTQLTPKTTDVLCI